MFQIVFFSSMLLCTVHSWCTNNDTSPIDFPPPHTTIYCNATVSKFRNAHGEGIMIYSDNQLPIASFWLCNNKENASMGYYGLNGRFAAYTSDLTAITHQIKYAENHMINLIFGAILSDTLPNGSKKTEYIKSICVRTLCKVNDLVAGKHALEAVFGAFSDSDWQNIEKAHYQEASAAIENVLNAEKPTNSGFRTIASLDANS